MATTYTGLTGRIVGFTWGTLWFAVGSAATAVIGDNFDILPSVIEQAISTFVPVLLTLAETGHSSIVVGPFFGVFAVIGLLYGGYEIVRVFIQSEYSITFTSRYN